METNKYEKIKLALQAAFFIEGRSDRQKKSILERVAQLPSEALEKIMKLCVRAEKESSTIQRDYLHTMEWLMQEAREIRLSAKNESFKSEKGKDIAHAMSMLKKLSDA